MAGPHQRFADVGRRDRLGRRRLIPSVREDTALLRLEGAAEQRYQAACCTAEDTKMGKQGGQNAVLRLPSSVIPLGWPIAGLYQKLSAAPQTGRRGPPVAGAPPSGVIRRAVRGFRARSPRTGA